MNKSWILVIMIILFSCSEKTSVKVSARDSHKVLHEISKNLDSTTAAHVNNQYKSILKLSAIGKNGMVVIATRYGIRYDDIAFSDLIDYANKEKEDSNNK